MWFQIKKRAWGQSHYLAGPFQKTYRFVSNGPELHLQGGIGGYSYHLADEAAKVITKVESSKARHVGKSLLSPHWLG